MSESDDVVEVIKLARESHLSIERQLRVIQDAASKYLHNVDFVPSALIASECGREEEETADQHVTRFPVRVRCKKCQALIETTVHCDNCGTFEPLKD